ncbi:MAG: DUF5686 family protein, partial [Mucilaginibacter sp.]
MLITSASISAKAKFSDNFQLRSDSAITVISGIVTDAGTHKPLPFISVAFPGTSIGTTTNGNGQYHIRTGGTFQQLRFSMLGYRDKTVAIFPGKTQVVNIRMEASRSQLHEVQVVASRKVRYRNKGNPAVELIRQVISHKQQNRMERKAYLQYDQYERINMSLTRLSSKFLNGKFFRKYQFLLDSVVNKEGIKEPQLPVYMSEKLFQVYSRRNPAKTIKVEDAHKEVSLGSLIDSAGLDTYLNRLYGDNIELYDNNIFVLNNQFLSPIADHAPDYYKFFITDTITDNGVKLVKLAFTPRDKGDLVFEGSLTVVMDSSYAVKAASMGVNRLVNLNFLRSFHINLDFDKQNDGRYYLTKSQVSADFGIFKNKGFGVTGVRTAVLSNFLADKPMAVGFYNGNPFRKAAAADAVWKNTAALKRPDTLPAGQAKIYHNFDSLQTMPSYRRTQWIAKTLVGGYADLGPVQIGPDEALYAYNPLEGSRVTIGGRTTPLFNSNFYMEGYGAYGEEDEKFKGYLSGSWSFNELPYYHYPNDFIRVSYQYDTDIPGQNFLISKTQSPLLSLTRGTNNLWLYDRIIRAEYVKDFDNHITINAGFKTWHQQAA